MALEIDIKTLENLWLDGEIKRLAMGKCWDYYRGRHAILKREEIYSDGSKKTNCVANWARYIVNRYIGALTSIPYQVSQGEDSDDKAGVDVYAEIARENNLAAQDVENLRNALTRGYGIEVHEFDGEQIRIYNDDPRHWLLLYDGKQTLVGAIKRITLKAGQIYKDAVLDQAVELMTYYNKATITDYELTGTKGERKWEQIGEPTIHGYKAVPIVVWKVNKNRESIITDDLIGQLDEYNDIDSASGDDIRNATNAMLAFIGFDTDWLRERAFPNSETDKRTNAAVVAKDRSISLPPDGDAKYIMKILDVKPTNDRLRRTREIIHMTGEVPDVETIVGATGNTSGIALKLKFLPMMQRAAGMINYLKESIRTRIKLINAIHSTLGSRDTIENPTVTIQFYLPVNRIEEWQNIEKLKDTVSHMKRLELLSDVDDAQKEIDRMKEERVDSLETRSPADTAAAQEMIIQRASAGLQPVIEQITKTIGSAATNHLLESGLVERLTAARQKEAA